MADLSVAIIGGGFSGTLAACNLVKHGNQGLSLAIFDGSEEPNRGVAYSTGDPCHLLNVRAAKMGASPDDEAGFYSWQQLNGYDIPADEFAPRTVYGKYIESVFSDHLRMAESKNIAVKIICHPATAIKKTSGKFQIESGAETNIFDKIILATGNGTPHTFSDSAFPAYINDVWTKNARKTIEDECKDSSSKSIITIIGTGLTMVDMVLSLHNLGFKGRIISISRGGLLPSVHSLYSHKYASQIAGDPGNSPQAADGLVNAIKDDMRRAEESGGDWREAIDSLRPVTQAIWRRLPPQEKKKFLRDYFSWWNVHRHRMPPQSAGTLAAMQKAGVLEIISDSISKVESTPGNKAKVICGGREIIADLVLNCAGPQLEIMQNRNPIIMQALEQNLVSLDEIGVGLKLADGAGSQNVGESIYAIGTILTGELLESTAVPELRAQTALAAREILE